MKVRAGIAIAAWAVARVSAQSLTTYSGALVSYTTITVDDCPTASMETMITVTDGITVTYCPECDPNGGGSASTPAPTNQGPGYTTTYTTTYLSLCPTGLTTVTYTVTESCTDEQPTWTPGPGHIPAGFTVTEIECTVCGMGTPTVTVTEPCGCEATNGVPVSPQNTPVQQISDGQVQNPTPGRGPPNNNSPAPTGSACNGADCGGSAGQPPSSPAASMQCPGPECRATATQSPAPAVGPGGSSTSPSYEGTASSMHVGLALSIVLSAVGALAFLL